MSSPNKLPSAFPNQEPREGQDEHDPAKPTIQTIQIPAAEGDSPQGSSTDPIQNELHKIQRLMYLCDTKFDRKIQEIRANLEYEKKMIDQKYASMIQDLNQSSKDDSDSSSSGDEKSQPEGNLISLLCWTIFFPPYFSVPWLSSLFPWLAFLLPCGSWVFPLLVLLLVASSFPLAGCPSRFPWLSVPVLCEAVWALFCCGLWPSVSLLSVNGREIVAGRDQSSLGLVLMGLMACQDKCVCDGSSLRKASIGSMACEGEEWFATGARLRMALMGLTMSEAALLLHFCKSAKVQQKCSKSAAAALLLLFCCTFAALCKYSSKE
ncbi:hypothetical protein M5K25_016028 [Dendrobium thyrsiflorum]|uniref:Uncharacterized protein n=1 Tax=Dendrobium thyrsiflorum TaxID=117978 RepID=A0ABD0USH8_DENTH